MKHRLDPTYAALLQSQPALFVSPAGGIHIFVEPEDIARVEAATAARLRAKELPEAWSRVGVVYEDQYVRVLRDAVRFPDGYESTYIRLLHCGRGAAGAAVLAVRDGKVILLRHFRHATRAWHLEVPRGFAQGEQTPEACARAELMEEVGGVPHELVELGVLHTDSGLVAAPVYLFFALLTALGDPERQEAIESLVPVEPAELAAMIACGDITDSFTIAAYTRARLRGML